MVLVHKPHPDHSAFSVHPAGQELNNHPLAFTREGCTDNKAQTSCPFSLPTYAYWCKRPPLELDSCCGFILQRGTCFCSMQGPRASACLQQPRGKARVCHSAGNLDIRRALQAAPGCSVAKALLGGRNSPSLAGCHRLRGAVPSRCSACSSSHS